jgi:hypothetical protein
LLGGETTADCADANPPYEQALEPIADISNCALYLFKFDHDRLEHL